MKTYLLFFFNFLSLFTYSQSKKTFNSKEYAFLQTEIRKFASSNLDSALIVSSKLEKSDEVEQKLFAKGTIAYLFQLKGDTLKSDEKLKEANLWVKKMPNSDGKYRSLACLNNYMGLIDWQRRKLTDALMKFNQGVEFSKKINDIKQIIKLEINIATINNEIENYRLAINSLKKSEQMIREHDFLFTEDESLIIKSSLFLNLGKNYEFVFKKDGGSRIYLDSALVYYKKAVAYSKLSMINKVRAQNNIAGVYSELKRYDEAISVYQNIMAESSQNNLENECFVASYNLGYTYFLKKKFEKALIYFEKVDSMYHIDNSRIKEYTYSKYYQSKIYESYKDYDNATHFASIYLDNLESDELKLNDEKEKINNILNSQVLKKEMLVLKNKYKTQVLLKKGTPYLLLLIILLLIYFVIRNYNDKKLSEAKFTSILDQYKEKAEMLEISKSGINELEAVIDEEISPVSFNVSTLNLDEEKEEELLQKLKDIESKKIFLNQDFTLQFVAKKIKTNTTYLSYIVNKNFGKTFSEYANELKISHVINEMIVNPKYRKYSTQAIAESVGYKNATSFARSFNKKTGLSPVQFAQKLEQHNIDVE